jgi:hypothetical protein
VFNSSVITLYFVFNEATDSFVHDKRYQQPRVPSPNFPSGLGIFNRGIFSGK